MVPVTYSPAALIPQTFVFFRANAFSFLFLFGVNHHVLSKTKPSCPSEYCLFQCQIPAGGKGKIVSNKILSPSAVVLQCNHSKFVWPVSSAHALHAFVVYNCGEVQHCPHTFQTRRTRSLILHLVHTLIRSQIHTQFFSFWNCKNSTWGSEEPQSLSSCSMELAGLF